MKFLFDLFPVLVFFAVYTATDIFVATAAMIVATLVQVVWLRMRQRPIPPMMWVTLAIVTIFGGLTIYFNDNRFMLWKPTVLYWLFSMALVISVLFFKRNLIRTMLAEADLRLPDPVWKRLNWAWVIFFGLAGVLNLYVAFNYPEPTWVKAKTFGFPALMFLFIVGQMLFLSRYIKEEEGQ